MTTNGKHRVPIAEEGADGGFVATVQENGSRKDNGVITITNDPVIDVIEYVEVVDVSEKVEVVVTQVDGTITNFTREGDGKIHIDLRHVTVVEVKLYGGAALDSIYYCDDSSPAPSGKGNAQLYPTTEPPTSMPTGNPTASPTGVPTSGPTSSPTATPTAGPTSTPTATPTESPTQVPTSSPTACPLYEAELIDYNYTSPPRENPIEVLSVGNDTVTFTVRQPWNDISLCELAVHFHEGDDEYVCPDKRNVNFGWKSDEFNAKCKDGEVIIKLFIRDEVSGLLPDHLDIPDECNLIAPDLPTEAYKYRIPCLGPNPDCPVPMQENCVDYTPKSIHDHLETTVGPFKGGRLETGSFLLLDKHSPETYRDYPAPEGIESMKMTFTVFYPSHGRPDEILARVGNFVFQLDLMPEPRFARSKDETVAVWVTVEPVEPAEPVEHNHGDGNKHMSHGDGNNHMNHGDEINHMNHGDDNSDMNHMREMKVTLIVPNVVFKSGSFTFGLYIRNYDGDLTGKSAGLAHVTAYILCDDEIPTSSPVVSTSNPTMVPTTVPTNEPTPDDIDPSSTTSSPTTSPFEAPTSPPTSLPTGGPTAGPTASPMSAPTASPTSVPTMGPTAGPTMGPTTSPTAGPTMGPTAGPTMGPTAGPTMGPTFGPTETPTSSPTSCPEIEVTAEEPYTFPLDFLPVSIVSLNETFVTVEVIQAFKNDTLCVLSIASKLPDVETYTNCEPHHSLDAGDTRLHTAQCFDGMATISVWVHDPELMEDGLADFPTSCEVGDVQGNKYTFLVPCSYGPPQCAPVMDVCDTVVTKTTFGWNFFEEKEHGVNTTVKSYILPEGTGTVVAEFVVNEENAGELVVLVGDDLGLNLGHFSPSEKDDLHMLHKGIQVSVTCPSNGMCRIKVVVPPTSFSEVFKLGFQSFKDTVFATDVEVYAMCSAPTASPTSVPTMGPTAGPTMGPTTSPSAGPTMGPTAGPTMGPTAGPTMGPTAGPTMGPTFGPTETPTSSPTSCPAIEVTAEEPYTFPLDFLPVSIVSLNETFVTVEVIQAFKNDTLCVLSIASKLPDVETYTNCEPHHSLDAGDTRLHTAQCFDGMATISVWVHDPEFMEDGLADFPTSCEVGDVQGNKYTFLVPCSYGPPQCAPVMDVCDTVVTKTTFGWNFFEEKEHGVNTTVKSYILPEGTGTVVAEFVVNEENAGELVVLVGDDLGLNLGHFSPSEKDDLHMLHKGIQVSVTCPSNGMCRVKVVVPPTSFSEVFKLGFQSFKDTVFATDVEVYAMCDSCPVTPVTTPADYNDVIVIDTVTADNVTISVRQIWTDNVCQVLVNHDEECPGFYGIPSGDLPQPFVVQCVGGVASGDVYVFDEFFSEMYKDDLPSECAEKHEKQAGGYGIKVHFNIPCTPDCPTLDHPDWNILPVDSLLFATEETFNGQHVLKIKNEIEVSTTIKVPSSALHLELKLDLHELTADSIGKLSFRIGNDLYGPLFELDSSLTDFGVFWEHPEHLKFGIFSSSLTENHLTIVIPVAQYAFVGRLTFGFLASHADFGISNMVLKAYSSCSDDVQEHTFESVSNEHGWTLATTYPIGMDVGSKTYTHSLGRFGMDDGGSISKNVWMGDVHGIARFDILLAVEGSNVPLDLGVSRVSAFGGMVDVCRVVYSLCVRGRLDSPVVLN